jgi:hypothetical protein
VDFWVVTDELFYYQIDKDGNVGALGIHRISHCLSIEYPVGGENEVQIYAGNQAEGTTVLKAFREWSSEQADKVLFNE